MYCQGFATTLDGDDSLAVIRHFLIQTIYRLQQRLYRLDLPDRERNLCCPQVTVIPFQRQTFVGIPLPKLLSLTTHAQGLSKLDFPGYGKQYFVELTGRSCTRSCSCGVANRRPGARCEPCFLQTVESGLGTGRQSRQIHERTRTTCLFAASCVAGMCDAAVHHVKVWLKRHCALLRHAGVSFDVQRISQSPTAQIVLRCAGRVMKGLHHQLTF